MANKKYGTKIKTFFLIALFTIAIIVLYTANEKYSLSSSLSMRSPIVVFRSPSPQRQDDDHFFYSAEADATKLTQQNLDLSGCSEACQKWRRLKAYLKHDGSSQHLTYADREDTKRYAEGLKCDGECKAFGKYLEQVPDWKTKGVIYTLTRLQRVPKLISSLKRLDKHFNDEHHYPLIIFHEQDYIPSKELIRNSTNTKIFFQLVKFELPGFVNKSRVPVHDCYGYLVGYRHMCRFHSIRVSREAIMQYQDLEYVWRMDDDSDFLTPIKYDPMAYMKEHRFLYGYMKIITGTHGCYNEFWESVNRYVNQQNETHFPVLPPISPNLTNPFYEKYWSRTNSGRFQTQFFKQWPNPLVYFNNFEISAISLWRSIEYQNYAEYIDRLGGIFYYRWGDAEIRTAAVAIFLPADRVVRFWGIAYHHHGWRQGNEGFDNGIISHYAVK